MIHLNVAAIVCDYTYTLQTADLEAILIIGGSGGQCRIDQMIITEGLFLSNRIDGWKVALVIHNSYYVEEQNNYCRWNFEFIGIGHFDLDD